MLENINQPLEGRIFWTFSSVQMRFNWNKPHLCLVCVFKVCVRLVQQKPAEGQPADHTHRSRTPPCGSQRDVALCSDEDWVRNQKGPFLGQRVLSLVLTCSCSQRVLSARPVAESRVWSCKGTERQTGIWGKCARRQSAVRTWSRSPWGCWQMFAPSTYKSWSAGRVRTALKLLCVLMSTRCVRVMHGRFSSAESDLTTLQDAEKVAKNLMALQERLFSLLQQVDKLRGHTHKQVGSLYRAEVRLQKMEKPFADSAAHRICSPFCCWQVDLDIKLRACAGSCRSLEPFSADHDGYRALESDVEQLHPTLSRRWSTAKPPKGIPQVRLLRTVVSSPRGGAKLQRELLMQLQLIGQKLMVLDPPPEQKGEMRRRDKRGEEREGWRNGEGRGAGDRAGQKEWGHRREGGRKRGRGEC